MSQSFKLVTGNGKKAKGNSQPNSQISTRSALPVFEVSSTPLNRDRYPVVELEMIVATASAQVAHKMSEEILAPLLGHLVKRLSHHPEADRDVGQRLLSTYQKRVFPRVGKPTKEYVIIFQFTFPDLESAQTFSTLFSLPMDTITLFTLSTITSPTPLTSFLVKWPLLPVTQEIMVTGNIPIEIRPDEFTRILNSLPSEAKVQARLAGSFSELKYKTHTVQIPTPVGPLDLPVTQTNALLGVYSAPNPASALFGPRRIQLLFPCTNESEEHLPVTIQIEPVKAARLIPFSPPKATATVRFPTPLLPSNPSPMG